MPLWFPVSDFSVSSKRGTQPESRVLDLWITREEFVLNQGVLHTHKLEWMRWGKLEHDWHSQQPTMEATSGFNRFPPSLLLVYCQPSPTTPLPAQVLSWVPHQPSFSLFEHSVEYKQSLTLWKTSLIFLQKILKTGSRQTLQRGYSGWRQEELSGNGLNFPPW